MADPKRHMSCPECGAPMNHHGEKLVDPRNAEEARRMKPRFEGVIEEIHCCPQCGAVGSRPGE